MKVESLLPNRRQAREGPWSRHVQCFVAVVQSPSCVWLFVTPLTAACQASLSLTMSWNLPKFVSITLVMPSSHLILWHPLLFLPSIFLSIRDVSKESSVCIRQPKYWSFSISPSSEYSGLITLKIDWFDLLAIQGTFRSLLQHHNLKASILQHSIFFMVQLSQPYMTTGKTIALTTYTFVGRVMSLPTLLSRFVISFLPRSNFLLISWLQSPSSVILEPNKRKHVTASTFSPYLPSSNGAESDTTEQLNWTELNWMGLNAMILVFLNI